MNQSLFILLLIAAVAFSFNPIIANTISDEVSFSGYILVRFLFIILFLPIIAVVMSEVEFKSFFQITAQGYRNFFLLSIFFASNMLLFYFSFNFIDVNRALFLSFTYPVFTVILAKVFLKEQPTPEELVAVFFTLVGAGFLFLGDGLDSSTFVGDAMVLVSSLLWAGYLVLNRYTALREVHYRQTFWVFLFSSILIAPFFYFFDYTNLLNISQTAIFALLAFGFISSLLPFTILNYAAKHTRSTIIGLFIILSMIFTIVLSVVFLGEQASPNVIFGGALVILAAIISIMSFRSVFLLNQKIKNRIKQSSFISIMKKIFKKESFSGTEESQ